jgi:hypothetical protein
MMRRKVQQASRTANLWWPALYGVAMAFRVLSPGAAGDPALMKSVF